MADTFVASGTTYSFDVLVISTPRSREAGVSVRHIPYSQIDIIDMSGKRPTRSLTLSVAFDTAAHYDAFEAAAPGLSGTLTYIDGALSALCIRSTRTRRFLNTGGRTHADVEFLLLS